MERRSDPGRGGGSYTKVGGLCEEGLAASGATAPWCLRPVLAWGRLGSAGPLQASCGASLAQPGADVPQPW